MMKRRFWRRILGAGVVLFSLLALPRVAGADPEADTILKTFGTAVKAVKTLSADMTLTQSNGSGPVTTTTASLKLKRPNLARIELGKPFQHTIASDGKSVWLTENANNRYQQHPADPQGKGLASFLIIPVGMFFEPEFCGFIDPTIQGTRFVGKETVEGQTYQVVEIHGSKPYDFTLTCYVDSDHLVTRTRMQMKLGAETLNFGTVLSHIKLNEPLADKEFAYAPPAGAGRIDLSDPAAKLLPVGEKAARFSIPTPAGDSLALDEVLKGKKAVLINFWFYGCEPCRKEFPALQKLYAEFKDRGFEMVALNYNDSAETIQKYVADSHFTFRIGMVKDGTEPKRFSVLQQYHVAAFPTSYLLDAEGKVIWRGVGFNEPELRAALKKAGVE